MVLPSIDRLAAVLCARHHDTPLKPCTELDKEASNNKVKPVPAEDCYFSHSAEQMAAPNNRNVMLKKNNNCFKQNKVQCCCQTYSLNGTTSSTRMVDQLCIIFCKSIWFVYAAKLHYFCDSLIRLLSSANGGWSLNNVQTSCLYSEAFN